MSENQDMSTIYKTSYCKNSEKSAQLLIAEALDGFQIVEMSVSETGFDAFKNCGSCSNAAMIKLQNCKGKTIELHASRIGDGGWHKTDFSIICSINQHHDVCSFNEYGELIESSLSNFKTLCNCLDIDSKYVSEVKSSFTAMHRQWLISAFQLIESKRAEFKNVSPQKELYSSFSKLLFILSILAKYADVRYLEK